MNEATMKKDALQKQYKDITTFYDLAEELAATVESEFIQDPDNQLALVEPVISQIADSTDVLAEEFIRVLENPGRKKSAKSRVESALRKIFMALEEYRNRLGLRSKRALAALANIADPVMDKIRKQAEKIIVIFMQLMDLSLERIMHKYEIEEFKRNNSQVVQSANQLRQH
jgi:hypothetical protein